MVGMVGCQRKAASQPPVYGIQVRRRGCTDWLHMCNQSAVLCDNPLALASLCSEMTNQMHGLVNICRVKPMHLVSALHGGTAVSRFLLYPNWTPNMSNFK